MSCISVDDSNSEFERDVSGEKKTTYFSSSCVASGPNGHGGRCVCCLTRFRMYSSRCLRELILRTFVVGRATIENSRMSNFIFSCFSSAFSRFFTVFFSVSVFFSFFLFFFVFHVQ